MFILILLYLYGWKNIDVYRRFSGNLIDAFARLAHSSPPRNNFLHVDLYKCLYKSTSFKTDSHFTLNPPTHLHYDQLQKSCLNTQQHLFAYLPFCRCQVFAYLHNCRCQVFAYLQVPCICRCQVFAGSRCLLICRCLRFAHQLTALVVPVLSIVLCL